MRILVTGSSGHLGEALMWVLGDLGIDVVGLDVVPSDHTGIVGSITDRPLLQRTLDGVAAVIHTATLHKPHVAVRSRADFVATNVTGTLAVLEESANAGVKAFVYTSTTSAFGRSLQPPPDRPAVWVTEDLVPQPRNIYGISKVVAEDLCELVHRDTGMPCLVLRTGRFFPESDDQDDRRSAYGDLNLKVNELLYRRIDLVDVVEAHLAAVDQAPRLGFGRYVLSATTPFEPRHLPRLRYDAPGVVAELFPGYEEVYERFGWSMLPSIDRVYVNQRARTDLGWQPRYGFGSALERLESGDDPRSDLAVAVGAKGAHHGTAGGT
jgi:nucleoside-diphosphate-sugar epimerase